MQSPKQSALKWGLSDFSKLYITGAGTNAVTSIGSGSIVVTTTPLREGQIIIACSSNTGDNTFNSGFVGYITSTGLSSTYVILTGSAVTSGGTSSVLVFATDAIFNVKTADITKQTPTAIGGSTITVPTALSLGDFFLAVQGDGSGTMTSHYYGEVTTAGTTFSYRSLGGTFFVLSASKNPYIYSFSPRYCIANLEGIDVEEVVKVESPDNGVLQPLSLEELTEARENYCYDNTLAWHLLDKNRLALYRGITTTNGCFLRGLNIYYMTENSDARTDNKM